MKHTQKAMKPVTLLLAIGMLFCMTVPAFAATQIDVAGGEGTTPVTLTVEEPTFSVTVPTSLPVSVDADGVTTYAENVKIVNNGHGAVKVSNMTISGANEWAVQDFDTFDPAKAKVNAKQFAMTVNGDKTTGADAISFTAANFPSMDGKNDADTDELAITYEAKVAAQSAALTNVSVANVVFTVGWDAE